MRKDLLALGLIVSFVGLVSIAVSQVPVVPNPSQNWVTVPGAEVQAPESSYNMSVQGILTQGDRFRVYFQLGLPPAIFSMDATVLVNLTYPNGSTKLYDIPIGSSGGTVGIMAPFPEGTVNETGTYKANAEAYFITIIYLAFQKVEVGETEPQYPYSTFLLVGGGAFAGGIGIIVLGAKIPKRKKRFRRR